MHKLATAAFAASICFVPSLAFAESRVLDVPAFTGVDIDTGIAATITVGVSQSVIAEAPATGDFDKFRYEVRNGVLHVWYDWDIGRIFDFGDRSMTLTISAPSLDYIESSSGASVTATGLAGENLTLEASSGAHITAAKIVGATYKMDASSGAGITLDGTCTTASVDVSSGASINAAGLACSTLSVDASSGSHIEIGASDSISADVSSGAGVIIHGRPRVDSLDASSGGGVTFVE
jgi:hypothetical protein